MEGVGVGGPVLKAKPFPYHLGLFKRLCDSGLKGTQLAGAAENPGRARGGELGSRTPGDPPPRQGLGRKSFPELPGWEWGRDTGPDLCPYLSRRSPGGPLGGGGGLRSLSPPSSGRQSGGSLGSAPPREPRDPRSGKSVLGGGAGGLGDRPAGGCRGRERGRGGIREAAGAGGGPSCREACGEETQPPRSGIRGPAPWRAYTWPTWVPAARRPAIWHPGPGAHPSHLPRARSTSPRASAVGLVPAAQILFPSHSGLPPAAASAIRNVSPTIWPVL